MTIPKYQQRWVVLWALVFALLGFGREVSGLEVNKNAILLLISKDGAGKQIATGTGFVVKPDGTLVTNYHVLVDASSVDAVFPNGDKVPVAGVLKVDPIKDFALLRLKEDFYSTLEMGDSGAIKEYDYSAARGYIAPEAMEGANGDNPVSSVQTYGFVLGVHPQAYPDFPYIYTTTPFSPGFSGGPLMDQDNKVIGLATVEGRSINLALPIDLIKPFFKESKLKTFAELREEEKDSKEALYYRGNFALYALGDPERAVGLFKKVLEKDPGFVLARYDLATAYRDLGDIEKAIASYEQALKIHPDFPEALSNLGGYYVRAGKSEEAVKLFKRAIKTYPNFIQALSNLGATLNKLNRPKEAMPHLKKTLLLDPEFGIAHFNLGNAYFALKQWEDAQKEYGKSVRFGIDFLSLHWKMYEIHMQKDRPREAAKELEIVLEIDPNDKKAREKLLELSPH